MFHQESWLDGQSPGMTVVRGTVGSILKQPQLNDPLPVMQVKRKYNVQTPLSPPKTGIKKVASEFGPGTIESDDEIENYSGSGSEGEEEVSLSCV